MTFEDMTKVVPAGERGSVRVVHIEVTEQQARFEAMRSLGRGYRPVEAGPLCQLYVGGDMMMSDAANERVTNSRFVYKARGDVLIAGLGLGMVLVPVLRSADVRSVLVLEKSPDVITLVEEPVRRFVGRRARKLTVQNADAFEWALPPGATWDTIYLDIWPDINTDNLPEIATLKRRFTRRLRPGGWLGAWVEDTLRSQRRQQRRHEYEPGFRCGTR